MLKFCLIRPYIFLQALIRRRRKCRRDGGIFCYSCYSFVCTLMNSARSLEYRMVWLLYSPQ